jgi:hypothetical protein
VHLVSEEVRLEVMLEGKEVVVLEEEPTGTDVEVEIAIGRVVEETCVEPLVPEVRDSRIAEPPSFGADEVPVRAINLSSLGINGSVPAWEVNGRASKYTAKNDGSILDDPFVWVATTTHMLSHRMPVVSLRVPKLLSDVEPIGKRRALVIPMSAGEPAGRRQHSQRQFPEIPTVHIATSVDKETQRAVAKDRPTRNVCPVTLNNCRADTYWCGGAGGFAQCLRAAAGRNGLLVDAAVKDVRERKPQLKVIPLWWPPAQTCPPHGGIYLAQKVVTAVVAVEPDA